MKLNPVNAVENLIKNNEVEILLEGSKALNQRPAHRLIQQGQAMVVGCLMFAGFAGVAEAHSLNGVLRDLNQAPITRVDTRPVQDLNQLRNAREGQLVMCRQVRVQGQVVNTGSVVGALVGAAVADRATRDSRGSERNIARALGAAGGGLVGGRVQNTVTNQNQRFDECVIRTGNRGGRLVSVVTPHNPELIPGEWVLYSTSRNNTFIIPISPQSRQFLGQGEEFYGHDQPQVSVNDEALRRAYEAGLMRGIQKAQQSDGPPSRGQFLERGVSEYGEVPPGYRPRSRP